VRKLVSDKKKQFDFLFIATFYPESNSGGGHILYSLTRLLSDHGYNVGWVVISNPYRFIYGVTQNPSLLPYVGARAMINILKSKIGYILHNRLMEGDHNNERTLEGILVLSPPSLSKLTFKRLIASSWETTYFVNYHKAECAKYNIIQYGDDPIYDRDYLQGVDFKLLLQTFSFPLKKIVINELHFRKFSTDKPQKLQLGIDTSKYYQTNPINERDGKTVLFPLRTHLEKGASVAIDAIKLIHRQRNDIKIITFGNYSQTTTIPEYVDHRGFIDDEELLNLYNRASVFVIPSLAEGFCLPGLEAMACGCAVITADNIGIREYVKHNSNGVIVPPNDSKAMADAIISLIDDSNQRNYLILNGLETAKIFSEENMVRSFLTAIKNFEQPAQIFG
jgi:glycosyltransferase involved in cell wall biosynthesis